MNTPNDVRMVVTGVGVLSLLGVGADMGWQRLLAGQSGIRNLPKDIADSTGTTMGA